MEIATAYLNLLGRVTEQTKRRVFGEGRCRRREGREVFEAHTDIIVKGGRVTHYGHKINLATARRSASPRGPLLNKPRGDEIKRLARAWEDQQ